MKKKQLLMLCAVLVVLGLLVILRGRLKTEVPTMEEWVDLVVEPLNQDTVTALRFSVEGGDTVALEKHEGVWLAPYFYQVSVDTHVLTSFLEKMDQLEGELRSSQANVFLDYGIDDASGVHIVLEGGGREMAHLVLGSNKAGWKGNFLRHHDSNDVHYVDENVLSQLGFQTEFQASDLRHDKWLDKKVFTLDASEVNAIKIADRQRVPLDVIRQEIDGRKKWDFTHQHDIPIDANKVRNFLNRLTSLRCQKFASVEETPTLESPEWILTLGLPEDQSLEARRGAYQSDERSYALALSDRPYLSIVSESSWKALVKEDADLFVDNPFGIISHEISQLSLRDNAGGQSIVLQRKEETVQAMNPEDETQMQDVTEIHWLTEEGVQQETAIVDAIINAIAQIQLKIDTQETAPEKGTLTISWALDKTLTIGEPRSIDDKDYHQVSFFGHTERYLVEKRVVDTIQESMEAMKE